MNDRLIRLCGPLTVALALAAFAGCGSIDYLTGKGPVARRPNVIPAVALRINPRLADGQRVYMEQCNECHVGGAAGLGPALVDKHLPQWLIRFQVRHGVGAMPNFSQRKISDDQLDDIVTYIRYLRLHPNGPAV